MPSQRHASARLAQPLDGGASGRSACARTRAASTSPAAPAPHRGLDPGLEAEGRRQLADVGLVHLTDSTALRRTRALGSQHHPARGALAGRAQLRLRVRDASGSLGERRERLASGRRRASSVPMLGLLEHGAAFTAPRRRPINHSTPRRTMPPPMTASGTWVPSPSRRSIRPLTAALRLPPPSSSPNNAATAKPRPTARRDEQQKPEPAHQRRAAAGRGAPPFAPADPPRRHPPAEPVGQARSGRRRVHLARAGRRRQRVQRGRRGDRWTDTLVHAVRHHHAYPPRRRAGPHRPSSPYPARPESSPTHHQCERGCARDSGRRRAPTPRPGPRPARTTGIAVARALGTADHTAALSTRLLRRAPARPPASSPGSAVVDGDSSPSVDRHAGPCPRRDG